MEYTPKTVLERGRIYGQVLIELEKCGYCEQYMANLSNWNFATSLSILDQLKNAGWEIKSAAVRSGRSLCVTCKNQGRALFTCYGCHEQRKSDLIQYTEGDPPDHLCKVCYETISAKAWDLLLDALRERHRFDCGR